MYAPELYQIYRLCKITGIHVQAEVVNTSATAPLTAVMCVLPLVRANAVTDPRGMSDVPNAITKQVGLSTGMSRVVLNKTYQSERELGHSAISTDVAYRTYSQALSAATLDNYPCIYMGVIASQTGANWTGIIKYVITYHVEFCEYDDQAPTMMKLGVAAKPSKRNEDMDDGQEDDSEEPSWVEPTPGDRAKLRKLNESRQNRKLTK